MRFKLAIAGVVLAVLLGAGGYFYATRAAPTAPTTSATNADTLLTDLREVLATQRKIIVLLADEKTLSAGERDAAQQRGAGAVSRWARAPRRHRRETANVIGKRRRRALRCGGHAA